MNDDVAENPDSTQDNHRTLSKIKMFLTSNYHFVSLFKKIVLTIALASFQAKENVHYIIATVISLIFLIVLIWTRPYSSIPTLCLKVGAEVCYSMILIALIIQS